jgi:hypothetical protein
MLSLPMPMPLDVTVIFKPLCFQLKHLSYVRYSTADVKIQSVILFVGILHPGDIIKRIEENEAQTS